MLKAIQSGISNTLTKSDNASVFTVLLFMWLLQKPYLICFYITLAGYNGHRHRQLICIVCVPCVRKHDKICTTPPAILYSKLTKKSCNLFNGLNSNLKSFPLFNIL